MVGEKCVDDADVILGRDDPRGVTCIPEDSLIERLTGLFMNLLAPCLLNWSFG